jgi:(p)ppGpp synthase/HD superfamily hydrolase
MTTAPPDSRIEAAEVMASRVHDGQVRKGSGLPYIEHPRAVAATLTRFRPTDVELICAGLLHDVIEDGASSDVGRAAIADEILVLSGPRVLELVVAVTKPRRGRWELDISNHDAVVLKAADVLSNVSDTIADIEADGAIVWTRFAGGRERKVAYYAHLASQFEAALGGDPLIAEVNAAIESLLAI